MNLHTDTKAFQDAIQAASQGLNIPTVFIEKDYWITLILKRLSESKYVDSVVFKGGTSLSKGQKLINRFSEDVDIAVIITSEMTGNQIKTLIRTVEKEIARELEEYEAEGITSKGSRFRKVVYKYPVTQKQKARVNISDFIIVEINSFANPYPYSKVTIQSLIGEHLQNNNQSELIKKYGLDSFKNNVLDKVQTMIEKLVSLFRFSFAMNPIESLSDKIRHFYDLYYLMKDEGCRNYLYSDDFAIEFKRVLNHDRNQFDEPQGWNTKEIKDSPLITDFTTMWNNLKNSYTKELSMLAYSDIPNENDVAVKFQELVLILDAIKE